MKAPIKRIKPKYYISPRWHNTVARFDTPDDNAKWFQEGEKRWRYSRYGGWTYKQLLQAYPTLHEIEPTKEIIKGIFPNR